ncbi:winged helix-turn-helix transcriptional regulator [Streptomyces sp. NPDC058045]|uniref:winged helix-turn-helix transcriptional regulator n=1 Tax=Streptomyces sp. NPDC058045 TaxID=3346311 RepID=UPI0036F17378
MAHQAVSGGWDEVLVPTPSGRTRAPSPDCPVEVSLTAIAGRWTTLVLRDLMPGDARSYTELAESLPQLSDKVLTDRLGQLVSAGLVARTVTRGFPRRTEYRITDRGRELRPLLIELYRTGLALQGHGAADRQGGRGESGRPGRIG